MRKSDKKLQGGVSTEMPVAVESKNTQIIKDPIAQAVKLSRKAEGKELETSQENRKKAEVAIEELEKIAKNLLPIEKGALPAIQQKKSDLLLKIKQLDSLKKYSQYAMFSLEPFKWRDRDGYPCLAVFNLNSPNFELSVNRKFDSYSGRTRLSKKFYPTLPSDISDLYKDVFVVLTDTAKKMKSSSWSVRAEFTTVLPLNARDQILKVRKEFKTILIIAAVKNWGDAKIPAKIDASQNCLVVGYDGSSYWLITTFGQKSLDDRIKESVLATNTGEQATALQTPAEPNTAKEVSLDKFLGPKAKKKAKTLKLY